MAKKYDKIILQVKKPSKKAFLVGIPMNLYRIQSHNFKEGINFFQKAVLKFKQRKDIQNSYISSILSIDEKLVDIIVSELISMKLLSNDGEVTQEGLVACDYTEGLIIDPNKSKIGYIFKFNNNMDYYPYYIEEFENRNVFSRDPFIVVLMQKDNESGEEKEYYSDEITIIEEQNTGLYGELPTPLNALEIMTRTSLSNNSLFQPEDCKKLSIEFIPNNNSISALVCTYIYLPVIDDNLYSSEWQVLDPFGFKNNVQLKFYIESCCDENVLKKIHDEFSTAQTSESLVYKEFQSILDNKIPNILNNDFGEAYHCLDKTKSIFLHLIVKTKLCMEFEGYKSRDNCDSFSSYIQKILEGVLIDDKRKRKDEYDKIKCLGHELIVGRKLHEICTNKFGLDRVPTNLGSQKNKKSGDSLLFYLMEFILTCENEEPSLFQTLKGQIQTICELAMDRNSRQHYGLPELLSMNEVEKYYNCIKKIINNLENNG